MPNFDDQPRQSLHRQPGPPNENLQRALAARDHYLKQNPQLMAFQIEIDRLLDLSGDTHGRMAVLATLMQGKMIEMVEQFKELNRYLDPPDVPANQIAAIDRPHAPTDCRWQNCA